MEDVQQLASIYAGLGPEHRRRLLRALVEASNPSDLHHLQHLLLSRGSMYFDIVGKLPVELSLQVLEHIRPIELIRLRTVSRQWHALLTSSATCAMASRRWFSNDVDIDSYVQTNMGRHDQWRRVLENLVSKLHFFTTGQPSGMMKLPGAPATWRQTAYHGSRKLVAWIDERQSTCFHILRFDAAEPASVSYVFKDTCAPQREVLDSIRFIEDYVVVRLVNGGTVYLWHLDSKKGQSFRLPNASFSQLLGAGNTVVVMRARNAYGEAVVYDADSRKSIVLDSDERGAQMDYRRIRFMDLHDGRLIFIAHNELRGSCFYAVTRSLAGGTSCFPEKQLVLSQLPWGGSYGCFHAEQENPRDRVFILNSFESAEQRVTFVCYDTLRSSFFEMTASRSEDVHAQPPVPFNSALIVYLRYTRFLYVLRYEEVGSEEPVVRNNRLCTLTRMDRGLWKHNATDTSYGPIFQNDFVMKRQEDEYVMYQFKGIHEDRNAPSEISDSQVLDCSEQGQATESVSRD